MWLQTLSAELRITLTDGTVWLSIGQGLLAGAICLVFGVFVARFVGLLRADAPAGETLGVGLASGLLVLASWWAALVSGGRSSFTPVAIGFAVAIGLAALRRSPGRAPPDLTADGSAETSATPTSADPLRLIPALICGALFVVVVALLYGATMAPSPRDGVQPVEFSDEAYYSVLGADLAKSGTESLYSPSGFEIGPPPQTWYHWGEIWLASALIWAFDADPIQARHLSVLPVLLLAVTALTGTLVRRMTGTTSRGAFLFGFFASLFLAPVPLISGPFFSTWAVGMIFGISLYGLAAVAVLLALYSVTILGLRTATWALEVFVGSAVAAIVPAHLAIGLLAAIGVGSVWAIKVTQSLTSTRRLPAIAAIWRRTYIAAGIAVLGTIVWGVVTGHGLGTSWLSPTVPPFDPVWRDSVAIVLVSSGAFVAIGIAWFAVRRERTIESSLYLGTVTLVIIGAVVWGARLGDLNMGYLFFGAIAVFATPVAAVAVWSLWRRLRAGGHARAGVAVLVFCVAQLEVGLGIGIVRLQTYGPGSYSAVPVETLAAIRSLPPGAKLAYSCRPYEEAAFWAPQLVSYDAHTGHRSHPDVLPGRNLSRPVRSVALAGRCEPAVRVGSAAQALHGFSGAAISVGRARLPQRQRHRVPVRGREAPQLLGPRGGPDRAGRLDPAHPMRSRRVAVET